MGRNLLWNCHNNLRALQVIDIMRRGLFKAPLPEEANLLSKILRGLGGGVEGVLDITCIYSCSKQALPNYFTIITNL